MCESRTAKPEIACHNCGARFISKQPKKHRFCCKKCADAWSQHNAPLKRHSICQHCGEGYHPKASNRTTFCSRECHYASRSRRARESKSAREAASKADKEANRVRALFARLRQCDICKAAFVAKNHKQLRCSDACKAMANMVSTGYDPLCKPCLICGIDVGPARPGHKRPHYCQQCAIEARKAIRRKNRLKREGRLSITSRDGMKTRSTIEQLREVIAGSGSRCPCCGLLMSRNATPNTDRYLELDHAIPVSKGGKDEWPNIRPLCRKCNGLKSDFTSPDIIISSWFGSSVHEVRS